MLENDENLSSTSIGLLILEEIKQFRKDVTEEVRELKVCIKSEVQEEVKYLRECIKQACLFKSASPDGFWNNGDENTKENCVESEVYEMQVQYAPGRKFTRRNNTDSSQPNSCMPMSEQYAKLDYDRDSCMQLLDATTDNEEDKTHEITILKENHCGWRSNIDTKEQSEHKEELLNLTKGSCFVFQLEKDHTLKTDERCESPNLDKMNTNIQNNTLNITEKQNLPVKSCTLCSESFPTLCCLKQHGSRFDHDSTMYSCAQCKKIFDSVNILRRHCCDAMAEKNFNLNSLRNDIDKTDEFQKPQLLSSTAELDILSTDNKLKKQEVLLRQHYTPDVRYKCTMCQKNFKYHYKLKRHQLEEHSCETRHVCSCCNREFYSQYSLMKHMRNRAGGRPFKCKVCDKVFVRRTYLERHSYVHCSEKPHPCSKCNKSFATKYGVRRHMKVHET